MTGRNELVGTAEAQPKAGRGEAPRSGGAMAIFGEEVANSWVLESVSELTDRTRVMETSVAGPASADWLQCR